MVGLCGAGADCDKDHDEDAGGDDGAWRGTTGIRLAEMFTMDILCQSHADDCICEDA